MLDRKFKEMLKAFDEIDGGDKTHRKRAGEVDNQNAKKQKQ